MERQGISCLAHAAAALAAAALLLAALPQAAGRPGVVAAPQPARRALRATTSGVTVYNQCDTVAPFNAGIYGAGFYAPRDGCDSGYDDPGGRLCLLWDRTVPAGGSAFLGFASSADTFWLTTLEHPSFPSQYISTSDRAFSGMFCSETSDPDACKAYTWFEVRAALRDAVCSAASPSRPGLACPGVAAAAVAGAGCTACALLHWPPPCKHAPCSRCPRRSPRTATCTWFAMAART